MAVFTRQGMCRDRGASSTSTLLTSGGSAAEARYIFVTYPEDWTNWVGAEEICRNQGYELAKVDQDNEATIESMMQAAGVNQVWRADNGANAVLMAAIFQHGECGFVGRRYVDGKWVLKPELQTWCSTPMGALCLLPPWTSNVALQSILIVNRRFPFQLRRLHLRHADQGRRHFAHGCCCAHRPRLRGGTRLDLLRLRLQR